MKTTLVSSTVSSNPFIRVYPIARILSEKFDTKIVGPVNSNGIYEPLRYETWNLQTVKERNFFPLYLKTCYDFYKKIAGKVKKFGLPYCCGCSLPAEDVWRNLHSFWS